VQAQQTQVPFQPDVLRRRVGDDDGEPCQPGLASPAARSRGDGRQPAGRPAARDSPARLLVSRAAAVTV
jgi:hypothetical protein